MGRGIDMARADAPEHAQLMEDMRDQLVIALLRRLGGTVDIPVSDVDAAGGYVVMMSVDPDSRVFHFEVRGKQ